MGNSIIQNCPLGHRTYQSHLARLIPRLVVGDLVNINTLTLPSRIEAKSSLTSLPMKKNTRFVEDTPLISLMD